MHQKQPSRILVLGSRPSTRAVESFGWEELPDDLNIADYDGVVFDLAPLMNDSTLAERVVRSSLPTPNQVMRLLKSPESVLVIIGGTPGTRLWNRRRSGGSSHYSLSSMFPVLPKFEVQESGTQIIDIVEDFGWYTKQVSRWTWWADPESFVSGPDYLNSEYLSEAGSSAETLLPQIEPLATTRFSKCVAFVLHYAAASLYGGRFDPLTDIIASFGPVLWLPQATSLTPKEAVEMLLV